MPAAHLASRAASAVPNAELPCFFITGECFCLLGPNGAGKSTTINCLTGVLPFSGGGGLQRGVCRTFDALAFKLGCTAFLATYARFDLRSLEIQTAHQLPRCAGDALVCGTSIASAGGMDRVRPLMGVCPQVRLACHCYWQLWTSMLAKQHDCSLPLPGPLPPLQFDVLWEQLTGREHLLLFGAIKGGLRIGVLGVVPDCIRGRPPGCLATVHLLNLASVLMH